MDEVIKQTAESLKNTVVSIKNPLERFNRKEYEDHLQRIKEDNLQMINMLETVFSLEDNREEVCKQAAKLFAELMEAHFQQIRGKMKREAMQADCNLVLTAYLFPLILDTEPENEKKAEYLANEIALSWKEIFPKVSLTPAKAEVIIGGFPRGILGFGRWRREKP